MPTRINQQRELQLCAEWLAQNYPRNHYDTRVRLGSLPAELPTDGLDDAELRAVHHMFARWADAVVSLPDRTIIVEAKLVAHPVAISQLQLYARLIPFTPLFGARAEMPVDLILLAAKMDPVVTLMASEQGIQVVQYDPPWVMEYLLDRTLRARRAPLAQELSPAS